MAWKKRHPNFFCPVRQGVGANPAEGAYLRCMENGNYYRKRTHELSSDMWVDRNGVVRFKFSKVSGVTRIRPARGEDRDPVEQLHWCVGR